MSIVKVLCTYPKTQGYILVHEVHLPSESNGLYTPPLEFLAPSPPTSPFTEDTGTSKHPPSNDVSPSDLVKLLGEVVAGRRGLTEWGEAASEDNNSAEVANVL